MKGNHGRGTDNHMGRAVYEFISRMLANTSIGIIHLLSNLIKKKDLIILYLTTLYSSLQFCVA